MALEQAFRRAATSGEYRAAMEARGEVAVGSTAEELKTRVAVEDAQLGAIVKSLGITKLNQTVTRPDSRSSRGIVAKVPHLLRIVE